MRRINFRDECAGILRSRQLRIRICQRKICRDRCSGNNDFADRIGGERIYFVSVIAAKIAAVKKTVCAGLSSVEFRYEAVSDSRSNSLRGGRTDREIG